MNIVQAIRKYHDDSRGCAWDIFWNYKCEIEEGGGSIFSDRHVSTTSLHLFAYLTCFGMARATTRLTRITVHEFEEILRKISSSYNAAKDIRFEALTKSDRDPVVKLLQDTKNALKDKKVSKDKGVSSTTTMITKIHLAAWGQTPAYDGFFKTTYKIVFPGQRFPSMPSSVFDSLLFLKEQYHAKWAEAIAQLPDKYRRTRPDGKYEIPPARLIDMAFWQEARPEQHKEESPCH